MNDAGFADHFSAAAQRYASARPVYPPALFDWIATLAPARGQVWEAGCGSGQATQGLAAVFDAVHATDPSDAQLTLAPKLDNVRFAVEPGERCSLPDASVDAVCVAQALHWFDRRAFLAEAARVLRPGGVVVAWGYQDLEVPPVLQESVGAFSARIRDAWPAERFLVDRAYVDFRSLFAAPPFDPVDAPPLPVREIVADWPLPRMLDYFATYSAVKRYREAHGVDPVAVHGWAIAAAWGDVPTQRMRWPLFALAARRQG